MRVFLTIIHLHLKVMVQYRTSFMMTILGEPMYFLINTVFFAALFAHNGGQPILGYDLPRVIWYFAGVSIVGVLLWNAADSNLSQKILSGDLALDLLRPVSTFQLELGAALAGRLMATALEVVPVLAIFLVVLFPGFLTVGSLLRFLVVMPASFVLFFLINYLVGLTAFYITSTHSLQRMKQFVVTTAAGGLVPLDFFPEAVRRVLWALPFPYLFYWPIQILLGRAPADGWSSFGRIMLGELVWLGVLGLACRLLWGRAIARYCSAGG